MKRFLVTLEVQTPNVVPEDKFIEVFNKAIKTANSNYPSIHGTLLNVIDLGPVQDLGANG